MVNSFSEFCDELIRCGFSMGGGSAKGIYAIIDFDWQTTIPGCPIQWHTGDPETDPWEWRMRVLEERHDIAYAKVFFGASGYITRQWYPLFLAVRRQGLVFDEWYDEGKATLMEKNIYEILSEQGRLPMHELKHLCGIHKEENSAFERALVSLQKNLFIPMCGRMQKKNKFGESYGWSSTVFCTVEDFWGDDLSTDISPKDAYRQIHDHILVLNPQAEEKNIRRFIGFSDPSF
ncbi:MAG: hypothetical protein K2K19_06530 [Acetatifactor sp.]|nr:hypothetical protein [Acetatifactor sp.]